MKKCITKHYQIRSPKVRQEGIRIVFISDLHNVAIGTENEKLLYKIDELKPDLVLVGGDIIIGKPGYAMDTGLQFMRKLAEGHSVYAANGNHEYRLKIYPDVYGEMYTEYKQTLEAAGVCLLENAKTTLAVKQLPVTIYGCELERQYYQRLKKQVLPETAVTDVFGELDQSRYNILLVHNPKYGQAYLNWGADLTLSGHYHGGIVRLGKNIPLLGNDFTLFPKFAYGHHQKDGRHLITSAGLGEHTIPVRINNPRELVAVDIQKK